MKMEEYDCVCPFTSANGERKIGFNAVTVSQSLPSETVMLLAAWAVRIATSPAEDMLRISWRKILREVIPADMLDIIERARREHPEGEA